MRSTRTGGHVGLTPSRNHRKGATVATTLFALVVLLAFMGMALDVGQVVLSAQQCQQVADAGCLGGAQDLPNTDLAATTALETARANIPADQTQVFQVTTGVYAEGEEIPNFGPAPSKGSFAVTATKWVDYIFLPVIGMQGVRVSRTAAAAHMDLGSCIAPMWVSEGTHVEYGLGMDMHFCDDPTAQSRMHGIFGWLDAPDGVDWDDALKGTVAPEIEELCRVREGDTVWNMPGQREGHWMHDLETDWDSRLRRAQWPPWRDDTFESFHHDNPRIMIVPFCIYEGSSGNNAYFTITRFGAWWLEDCKKQGSDKVVYGRFIDFTKPGGLVKGIKPTRLLY